jgi:uncharacterized protein YbbC (DUF1343 family)
MLLTNSYKSGLDILIEKDFSAVKSLKIGIIANQASVSRDYKHLVDIILESGVCEIKKIFAPEHGFRGELQDMESVDHSVDPKTGLKVISLYGSSAETLVPKLEDLKDIDILIADLPDIGTRYYTFSQTIAYTMAVAKEAGIKVLLLDRANPINGVSYEGLGLINSCRSFCGYAAVPHRYGLSLGELLNLYNTVTLGSGEDIVPAIGAKLEVIKVENWDRTKYADEIKDYPWVLPSPNMPTIDTAVIYPGSCLFEATEVSEGRGTTKPLEQFGAPYINPDKWLEAYHKEGVALEGAVLRPTYFLPRFQKHAGKSCGGLQIHVTDRNTFKPFRTCLALISSLKKLYPNEFSWRKQAFEFVDKVPAIDLLYGNSNFRTIVEKGGPASECLGEIEEFEKAWALIHKANLLY